MAMSQQRLEDLQTKCNWNTITPEEVKELIHEINLTRALLRDINLSAQFIVDTVGIIFKVGPTS